MMLSGVSKSLNIETHNLERAILDFKEIKEKNWQPQHKIKIMFSIEDLTKEIIDLILSVSDKFEIFINKDTFKLTQENCTKLVSLNEYIKEKHSKSLSFPLSTAILNPSKTSEIWSVEKVLNANIKMEDWANQINSARINGRELSPFEKYIYAYRIISRFAYNDENRGESFEISRQIVGVLNSNRIVCVGYADLLSQLCERIGIECYQQDVACDGRLIDHCNCCVKINDDKYNIHGIYYADPCWDSYRKETENTLQHSLLRCDEVDKGFSKDPIAFRCNALEEFKKTNKRSYTYQELKEIANKYIEKERVDELLKSVKRLRQRFKVKISRDKKINFSVGSISRTFNPNRFYKMNIDAFCEGEIKESDEFNIKRILENKTDKEIVENFIISEICLDSGNARDETLYLNGKDVYENISFENLDLVKRPSNVSKDMYCSALYNILLSQGKSKQEAREEVKKIWDNSIKEVRRTQSTGDSSFSTPFIEEIKSMENKIE